MKHFYVFNTITGQIEIIGTTFDDPYIEGNQDFRYSLERVNGDTHYHNLSNDLLTERPAFNFSVSSYSMISDGIDEVAISNIPNPCNVTWPDDIKTVVTDGEVKFKVDMAGEYRFYFDSFPYKTQQITIHASE